MRLTFLLSSSLDSPYGRGRCLPLARELARGGADVTILALHHDWERLREREQRIETGGKPLRVRYVGQMAVLKREGQKSYFPAWKLLWVSLHALTMFVLHGLRQPTDAFHVGKPQPMNGLAGWLLTRLRRLPLFVDCDDWEAGANRFSGGWQRALVAWVERWLPRQARGVTVNTTFLQRFFQAQGVPAERIVVVPNGPPVLPALERPLAPPLQAIAAQIARDPGPVIGYIGTLALESHAVELLLDAFDGVAAARPTSWLLLVGGGPDEALLRARAAQSPHAARIVFTGQIDAEAALHAYRLADLTVDPVHDDEVARARCPLKLMESLAAGRPIVTGDVGDRRAWLGAEFGGWLAEAGSPRALAEAICHTLDGSTEGHWTPAQIRERAALFAWPGLAAQWRTVYVNTQGTSP